MKVHIEGMGVYGSLLARKLHEQNVDFTWHDNDSSVTAWKACTGAIYPSGSTKFGPDEECRRDWVLWYLDGFCKPYLSQAEFWYSSKSPPHEGKYKAKAEHGGLRWGLPSLHLDAQLLVGDTRFNFASRRVTADAPRARESDFYIVAHSFGSRLSHYYWGWTRRVRLAYPRGMYGASTGGEAAFYLRPNRFQMAYAYPIGPSGWWYAGSNIILQGTPRSLDPKPKYTKWRELFSRYAPEVSVAEEGELLEGWRPAAKDEDQEWVRRDLFSHRPGQVTLTMRPLWNSGVRHFPHQWRQLAKHMGLQP